MKLRLLRIAALTLSFTCTGAYANDPKATIAELDARLNKLGEARLDGVTKVGDREAPVIFPPVNTSAFDHQQLRGDFYLCLGQLVGDPYLPANRRRPGRGMARAAPHQQRQEARRSGGATQTRVARPAL